MKTPCLPLCLAFALVGAVACRKEAPPPAPPLSPEPAKLAEPAPAAPAAAGKPGEVEVIVTDDGFVPERIPAKAGQSITLAITRKAERTCATEILFAGDPEKKKTPLPLNQRVLVTYTPTKSGEVKFGCAMGMMIGGVLAVE
jgi:plastocyanin domain-containing protein